ncbi:hypothetical protein O3P69_015075 [Scylla paramamosain]|uniref:Uncharacterized protein n=1 Tax=Scylla paramamosain TaxID=85552 RepID=A0AAW0T2N7_SCYPA
MLTETLFGDGPISICSATLYWQPIRLAISIARQEETFYSRTKPSQRRHLRPSAAKTQIITHITNFRFSEGLAVTSPSTHHSVINSITQLEEQVNQSTGAGL